MKYPPPRRSTFNKVYPGEPDYDMSSPINLSQFPCKGYAPGPIVASYTAGGTIPVELYGTATHNGGHCQFSLSYDNGATFVVISTIMNDCLTNNNMNYNIKIPEQVPQADKLIFSWTWVNRSGNREYYMNCADIQIKNSLKECSYTNKKMLVANLQGYPTIPEFPNASSYCGADLYDKCENVTVNSNNIQSSYVQPNNNTENYNNYNLLSYNKSNKNKNIASHSSSNPGNFNNSISNTNRNSYSDQLLLIKKKFDIQVQQLNEQYNQGKIDQINFSNKLNDMQKKFDTDCLSLKNI